MAPRSAARCTAIAVLGLGGAGLLLGMAGAPQPVDPPPQAPPGAWVELYDDAGLSGRKLTIRGGTNVQSLDGLPSDEAGGGFEDDAASVRWDIPVGWQLVLFEHKNFEGNRHELKGTGRIEATTNLGFIRDEASSARWEYIP